MATGTNVGRIRYSGCIGERETRGLTRVGIWHGGHLSCGSLIILLLRKFGNLQPYKSDAASVRTGRLDARFERKVTERATLFVRGGRRKGVHKKLKRTGLFYVRPGKIEFWRRGWRMGGIISCQSRLPCFQEKTTPSKRYRSWPQETEVLSELLLYIKLINASSTRRFLTWTFLSDSFLKFKL